MHMGNRKCNFYLPGYTNCEFCLEIRNKHSLGVQNYRGMLRGIASLVSFCLFTPVLPEYLDISDVDMVRNREGSNKQQHHTDFYNSDALIVRRGQEFQIKIIFNRPYKPTEDKFALEFVIGE